MTLAAYMTACLHHPDHGYYATRDPFGRAGDFVTAPEVSQMFGELLGLALAQSWLDQGAPEGAILAELGPGRGTLMADILRATALVPGFHDAMRLCLVEASPTLRALQASTLAAHDPEFFASVDDLPEAPLFLVANEFFDALPIRAFQRTEDGWAERVLGAREGKLAIGLGGPIPAENFARHSDFAPGSVLETCAPGEAIASELGRRIAAHGGAATIIDYGDAESSGTTFQAVRNHAYADPLAEPGLADLSAHVAFAPLIRAATPARGYGPVPQGDFLAPAWSPRARRCAGREF